MLFISIAKAKTAINLTVSLVLNNIMYLIDLVTRRLLDKTTLKERTGFLPKNLKNLRKHKITSVPSAVEKIDFFV